MDEKDNLLVSDSVQMQNIRQRVQRKIAGAYLEAIDPGYINTFSSIFCVIFL
jgi:hypothetical protein